MSLPHFREPWISLSMGWLITSAYLFGWHRNLFQEKEWPSNAPQIDFLMVEGIWYIVKSKEIYFLQSKKEIVLVLLCPNMVKEGNMRPFLSSPNHATKRWSNISWEKLTSLETFSLSFVEIVKHLQGMIKKNTQFKWAPKEK